MMENNTVEHRRSSNSCLACQDRCQDAEPGDMEMRYNNSAVIGLTTVLMDGPSTTTVVAGERLDESLREKIHSGSVCVNGEKKKKKERGKN